MQWWQNILPVQGAPSKDDTVLGRSVPVSTDSDAPDPEKIDRVMLIRNRISRILYMRKFFDYPISMNLSTLTTLGFLSSFKIGFSYIQARAFPIKQETSLEDFFINRFGRCNIGGVG